MKIQMECESTAYFSNFPDMVGGPTLHLSFEHSASGRTILRVKQQQPPWRVVRGFTTPTGETLAHIHNVSGGVLDTDVLVCRFDVGPRAQAQVTTTGATRIYRSRSERHTAAQRAEVSLAEGAYLEYVPDQLIPFAGSRFEQTTCIKLQPKASLIWWERIAPGREASGEIFRYESLASRLELVAEEQPIAIERWTLAPRLRRADSEARLGPFNNFASCYVCRVGEAASYWRNFESELQKVAERQASPGILWGVTCLKAHGLVIRGVSTSGRPLRDAWVEIWKAAKWLLCGRAAALPRKVH
jgi:urease accessory protein